MAIKPYGIPSPEPMVDDEKLKVPVAPAPRGPIVANHGPGSGGAPNVSNRSPVSTGIPANMGPGSGGAPNVAAKPVTPMAKPALNTSTPAGGIPANMGPGSGGAPNVANRPVVPAAPAARPVANQPAALPGRRVGQTGVMPPQANRPATQPNALRQKKRFDNGYGSQVTPGRWGMR